MQLFYSPNLNPNDTQLVFSKEESKHIGKVLRKQIGDTLHLTDGIGHLYEAILESNNPKQCIAIITRVEEKMPLPYALHMAVAPTKLNERFEWFLEKATEIGITEITPIICNHSERKVIKPERYEKIIQSAAKQSLKYHFPILNPVISFKEFIRKYTDDPFQKLIAHCEETEKASLKSQITRGGNHIIMIGPEGDFSNSEIIEALSKGFSATSLGTNRLRTETAAMIACHSISYCNEY
jgi:16S rRNA (uracil1498-N3)-methyltransferase